MPLRAWSRLKAWASALLADIRLLAIAVRDPRTPWYARAMAVLVVAYALSPIDLIPDAIPVLGYLDDAILLPLGVKLALRLIPDEVLEMARHVVGEKLDTQRARAIGVVLVISTWAALATLAALALRK